MACGSALGRQGGGSGASRGAAHLAGDPPAAGRFDEGQDAWTSRFDGGALLVPLRGRGLRRLGRWLRGPAPGALVGLYCGQARAAQAARGVDVGALGPRGDVVERSEDLAAAQAADGECAGRLGYSFGVRISAEGFSFRQSGVPLPFGVFV